MGAQRRTYPYREVLGCALYPQRLLDLVNLEVHDDRPVDIEGRRGLVVLGLVVCPISHLRLVW
jgi:hypothetical protein